MTTTTAITLKYPEKISKQLRNHPIKLLIRIIITHNNRCFILRNRKSGTETNENGVLRFGYAETLLILFKDTTL